MDVGDTLPFRSNLYNKPLEQGGVLVNALGATLTIALPDGTTATPTVPAPATTGTYAVDYPTTIAGRHIGTWSFTMAGGLTTSHVQSFDVAGAATLVTADEAAVHLRAAGSITTAADLDQLQWLCQVATEVVERDLGRPLTRRTVTEIRDGGGPLIVLRQTPVLSITSVVDYGTTLDPADYTLDGGILYRGSTSSYWTRFVGGRGAVVVTYVAGYLDPPKVARQVARSVVQSLWQSSQQASHPLLDEAAEEAVFSAVGSMPSHLQRAYESLRVYAVA